MAFGALFCLYNSSSDEQPERLLRYYFLLLNGSNDETNCNNLQRMRRVLWNRSRLPAAHGCATIAQNAQVPNKVSVRSNICSRSEGTGSASGEITRWVSQPAHNIPDSNSMVIDTGVFVTKTFVKHYYPVCFCEVSHACLYVRWRTQNFKASSIYVCTFYKMMKYVSCEFDWLHTW